MYLKFGGGKRWLQGTLVYCVRVSYPEGLSVFIHDVFSILFYFYFFKVSTSLPAART